LDITVLKLSQALGKLLGAGSSSPGTITLARWPTCWMLWYGSGIWMAVGKRSSVWARPSGELPAHPSAAEAGGSHGRFSSTTRFQSR